MEDDVEPTSFRTVFVDLGEAEAIGEMHLTFPPVTKLIVYIGAVRWRIEDVRIGPAGEYFAYVKRARLSRREMQEHQDRMEETLQAVYGQPKSGEAGAGA